MTNKQLKSLLMRYRFILDALSKTVVGCFIIAIILFICDKVVIGIVLCFGSVIIFGVLYDNAKKKIDSIINDNIVSVVLKETFGDSVEFDQNGKVTPGLMAFTSNYSRVCGDYHIKAVYNGLNIELSNLVLKKPELNSEGDKIESAFFSGQWLICDFGKELSGEVFISENYSKGKPYFKSDVTTNNEEFNDRFSIKAKVPEEALCILTPDMMECIMKIADRVNGEVYFSFMRDGKMNVAVSNKQAMFELGKTKSDYDALYQKFSDQIKVFTDIVDVICVQENIYKERGNE